MVTDGSYTCGEHSITYTEAGFLCCIPENNATCVTYTQKNFIIFLKFIYLRERERERMSRGGAERKGNTESEAGSRL